MRSAWTVSLLWALVGCGAITPEAPDAGQAAAPADRDAGAAGARPNAGKPSAPAACDEPCPNGSDDGMGKGGDKHGCEPGAPPCPDDH